MELNYKTIAEPTKAGAKWHQLFSASWVSYRSWLQDSEFSKTITLEERESALKKYMPKMWDTYVHLCSLIDTEDKELAQHFLTGYCPPAYVTACAQAVIKTNEVQLVRNYDYDPKLMEGTLLLSRWNERRVIATSDCLIGAVDGMNDDGLCVSLTFGGRKEVGLGFGIPFIVRYVLEFCSSTAEAVKVLKKIPSHMSYNVTVVDRSGIHKTLLLAPDRSPKVTSAAFATNHQQKVDWPENARFNQTLKRSNFIKSFLKVKDLDAAELSKAFLHPPLYNNTYKEGFGTLYTAVYLPETQTVRMLWPENFIEMSFDTFIETSFIVTYKQEARKTRTHADASRGTYNWQDAVVDSLVKTISKRSTDKKREELRKKLMPNGKVAWEAVVNYWNQSYPK